MSSLGLTRSEEVLVTVVDQVYPLERVDITPVTSDDWDLLVSLTNTHFIQPYYIIGC